MDILKNFLSKYTKLASHHSLLKEVSLNVINKKIGIELKSNDLKIDKNTIFIKCSPIIKSEIYILPTINPMTNRTAITI